MTRGSFFTILILLLVSLLIIVALLGWSLAIGWGLVRLVGFTLFEGTLLGLIASLAAGTILFLLISALPSEDEEEALDEDERFDTIDSTRFFKELPTSEQWFRYQTANAIYLEFQGSPEVTPMMNKTQQQELSIRLTDLAVEILKQRPKRTGNLKISLDELTKEMRSQNMTPYDDEILELAAVAVNGELALPMVASIVRQKTWDTPASRKP